MEKVRALRDSLDRLVGEKKKRGERSEEGAEEAVRWVNLGASRHVVIDVIIEGLGK